MYTKRTSNRIAAYTATATLLGGAAAQASVVHLVIDQTLTDPDTAAANTTATIGAIRFDGTTVTYNNTTTGGAASITAIDTASTKIYGAYAYANVGYVQTPEIINAGEVIGGAFTQTNTSLYLPAGSASNVYIGVCTPSKRYGWIKFSYTDKGKTVTIHEAAFETEPNKPIVAGSTTSTASNASPRLSKLAGGLAVLRKMRQTLQDA